LNAYPPARVDNAKRQWHIRRTGVLALQSAVPTALVACASWLAQETRLAGFEGVSVVTNSVDRAFWDAVRARVPSGSREGNVFICRDLRDAAKVRWDVLEGVAQQSHQSLTIVGDNADRQIENSFTRPSITSRVDLANVMLSNRNLIFTSQVDYYPLTVAEALVAGMRVFALDSPAIREFESHPRVVIAASVAKLVEAVALSDSSLNDEEEFLADEAIFDPSRMARNYLSIYEDLLAHA
jgi:putative colanic acid biosynthesis glycosyltransferase